MPVILFLCSLGDQQEAARLETLHTYKGSGRRRFEGTLILILTLTVNSAEPPSMSSGIFIELLLLK